jgi:hypothetical protein
MADDDWYKPHRPPVPPRRPKPGEHVWTLRRLGRQGDCELRFHGDESYGWECQCLFDGVLAYGHRSVLRAQAVEEAEAHRRRLLSEGWSIPASTAKAASEAD